MACFSPESILEALDYCLNESEMVERRKIRTENVYLDVKSAHHALPGFRFRGIIAAAGAGLSGLQFDAEARVSFAPRTSVVGIALRLRRFSQESN